MIFQEILAPSSDTHQRAFALGIPHGLVRSFREDLRSFIVAYRTNYRPARELLQLRERGFQEQPFCERFDFLAGTLLSLPAGFAITK